MFLTGAGAGLLFPGYNPLVSTQPALAGGAGASVTVTVEVSSSLGVSPQGIPSRSNKVIRIGDPASGMVSYIVLDD